MHRLNGPRRQNLSADQSKLSTSLEEETEGMTCPAVVLNGECHGNVTSRSSRFMASSRFLIKRVSERNLRERSRIWPSAKSM